MEKEFGLPDVTVSCPVPLRQRFVVHSTVVVVDLVNLILCYEYLPQLRKLFLHIMKLLTLQDMP